MNRTHYNITLSVTVGAFTLTEFVLKAFIYSASKFPHRNDTNGTAHFRIFIDYRGHHRNCVANNAT
jgi:hypothetical protein